MNYQIIEVMGGKVLTAHDVLTSVGIPCLAFVEIKRKTPAGRRKQERGKREAYVVSAFSRYLFADLSTIQSLMMFERMKRDKSYIYGAMGRGEALYAIKSSEFDGLRQIKHETGRYKGKTIYQDYSRAKHSRHALNKTYGQSVDVPQFSEGDIVSFIRGGLQGLIYHVDSIGPKGEIKMRGEQSFFGGVSLVNVLDPWILEKVA